MLRKVLLFVLCSADNAEGRLHQHYGGGGHKMWKHDETRSGADMQYRLGWAAEQKATPCAYTSPQSAWRCCTAFATRANMLELVQKKEKMFRRRYVTLQSCS